MVAVARAFGDVGSERCRWKNQARLPAPNSASEHVGVLALLTPPSATVARLAQRLREEDAGAPLERRREGGRLPEVELRGKCQQIFNDSVGLLEIRHVTA
jgi:hypothetical protein